ncbi:MAG: alanine--tRNA ligase [Candidatus Dadabacteria bacterium]|nr:alanine--tRNA ligase [Candidatus Dadabacteria bacterium]
MKASEIRRIFLKYFEENGHTIVGSSSLIPKNDPTLLFTNAGMVQFKDVFLGADKRSYKRATSCQKCVRAGGKHNDLEIVGQTGRHHTFFEMLGNFSFGDYFKREAINFGWELLTHVFKLPKDRLWVTVFREDDQAFDIWRGEIGLPPERIVRMGEKDNFWAMGEIGPCGPCSEIIIDQGEAFSCGKPSCSVGCDCDRYLELWNLVFMQYERDSSGDLKPLPKPSIDTGMGLERITAVLQGIGSNYETDLFRGIISTVEERTGKQYGENPSFDVSMRVIADHSRAVTFLVSDGVFPSNEGRGYVLRRILRRAVRHSRALGIKEPFLFNLANHVRDIMRDAYPELEDRLGFVREVVRNEEERFFETIDRGLELLNLEVERHKGDKTLPGEVAFKLYDTYGFPVDLTEDIAKESGLNVDYIGFEKEMERQRERSRQAWKGSGEEELAPLYKELTSGGLIVNFTGYEKTRDIGRITAIIKDGRLVDSASEGERVELITDKTPFYGEAGGQVGDRGVIEGESGHCQVEDTKKPFLTLIVHQVYVKRGALWVGDNVELKVDERHRYGAKTHHTTTHMLHAVLKEVLGTHVRQAGSLVAPERLRFDFTHFSSIDDNTIRRMEDIINDRVRWDDRVFTQVDVSYEEAIKSGATAIFEEKYGDRVRVVSIGEYSKELCGGTHLHSTGEVGLFKLVNETASSAGVRRIEAIAGESAWRFIRKQEETIIEASNILRVNQSDFVSRLKRMVEENERLRKELESFKDKVTIEKSKTLLDNIKEIKGINVLSAEVSEAGPDELRKIWDDIREKLKPGLAVLGSGSDGKAYILVGVTKDLSKKFHAGNIVKELASIIDGGGGGKPDMAQAGGNKPERLGEALRKVFEIVNRKL